MSSLQYTKMILCINQHSIIFPIVISLCTPLYSLTCVQKGYMVIDLVDGPLLVEQDKTSDKFIRWLIN